MRSYYVNIFGLVVKWREKRKQLCLKVPKIVAECNVLQVQLLGNGIQGQVKRSKKRYRSIINSQFKRVRTDFKSSTFTQIFLSWTYVKAQSFFPIQGILKKSKDDQNQSLVLRSTKQTTSHLSSTGFVLCILRGIHPIQGYR